MSQDTTMGIQGPMYLYALRQQLRCSVCLMLLCCTYWLTRVSADDWPELVAAKEFCSSPEFQSLKCGLAGQAEWDKAVPDSILRGSITSGALAGSLWRQDKAMPLVLSQGGKSYWSYAVDAISLACRGPVVARFVFKVLTQPEPTEPQNCSGIRLTPEADFAVTNRNPELENIPVVRCQLQLPEGPENETVRAVKATEGPCYICNACKYGGGCPGNTGAWYSDAYVTDTAGCDTVWAWNQTAQGEYRARTTAVVVSPDIEALVAKFEVCNTPGCFDANSEAQKLKDAKKCVNGAC